MSVILLLLSLSFSFFWCLPHVQRCAHPSGGYGGGPGQLPHLAPTFAACSALVTLGTPEALASIDRRGVYAFLHQMKDSETGAFRMQEDGETDVRGSYCALNVAATLNLLDHSLARGVDDWLLSCQTYEGGFGGEPGNEAHGGYTYCAVAALCFVGASHRIDLPSLIHWASHRQMRLEGGFQGRTNKLVDGCYSLWVGALFPLLDQVLLASGRFPYQPQSALAPDAATRSDAATVASITRGRTHGGWLYDPLALQRYLVVCCQDPNGGLIDKPGKNRDYYHTCYCLSGLATAQHTTADPAATALDGLAKNVLLATHPAFNVEVGKFDRAHAYFAAQPQLSLGSAP